MPMSRIIPKSQIEQVVIGLSEYGGRKSIDVRSHMAFNGAEPKPTKKGVSLPIDKIDELIDGLQQCRTEAVQQGWLK